MKVIAIFIGHKTKDDCATNLQFLCKNIDSGDA